MALLAKYNDALLIGPIRLNRLRVHFRLAMISEKAEKKDDRVIVTARTSSCASEFPLIFST
jgi:hypothetical protein